MANGKKTFTERLAIVETKIDRILIDIAEIKQSLNRNNKQDVKIATIEMQAKTNRKFVYAILFLFAGLIIKSFL